MTDVRVGVDGGGSGSRARAVTAEGTPVAEVEGGAAAVAPGGAAEAARRVAELVRRALGSAALDPPAASLCAALAGAGRPGPRVSVQSALRRAGVAGVVEVESDADAALRDAFGPAGHGVLLAAGTGSVALARGPDGITRAGGWGPLLGDEGGGYDLARRALRAAARSADGRAPPTALSDLLADRIGVDAPRDAIEWAAGAGRREIAELAPAVLAAAEDGDPTARRLAAEAAASLASCALAARERARPRPAARVALSGGLLAEGGPLRDRTAGRLRGLGLQVEAGSASALDGACRRAREIAP